MKDIIQLLPDSLANQIAAGEVVQRPASVVKELLENSVDAGAKNVSLIVKNAGKTLIQVIDDGCGMSVNDARMCFERHATSKILQTEDLFSIRTFGFRGEAMASIAAVAQVEMKTKQQEDEIGTKITIEGSAFKSQEPEAMADGTVITVKNLFFNVPARRNFLKSNPVELRHIIDEFQRVALAQPEVGFSFYQDDLLTYELKPGKLAKRVVGIFGKSYQNNLISCEEDVQHVRLNGYVGRPEAAKKTRGEQFFFVNDRFIKHPYLHHAVMSAFEGLLPEGTYPFYVIRIYLDPKHVDVNVHPTKTEIKFDDERTVYALVRASVKQALARQGAAPSIDFDIDVNFGEKQDGSEFHMPPNISQNPVSGSGNPSSNLRNWQKLYDDYYQDAPLHRPEASQEQYSDDEFDEEEKVEPIELKFSSAANEMQGDGVPAETPGERADTIHKKFFQVRNRYILTPVKSGIMIIDQEAAHQRILYERFMRSIENKNGESQKLVFPVSIELNPADFALMSEIKEDARAIGFDFEDFGKNTVVLRGLPSDLNNVDEKELIEDLLEQVKVSKAGLDLNIHQRIARALAKRAAIKKGLRLQEAEMHALIEQLFVCSNPNYTPGGRKTVAILNMEDLESLFS